MGKPKLTDMRGNLELNFPTVRNVPQRITFFGPTYCKRPKKRSFSLECQCFRTNFIADGAFANMVRNPHKVGQGPLEDSMKRLQKIIVPVGNVHFLGS